MERNYSKSLNGNQNRQRVHADQGSLASARPKISDKPNSLALRTHNDRTDSTTEGLRDVTSSCGLGSSSLVRVYDTATTDGLYDDFEDEFGFFSKGSPDTVTVTIKFSSAEKGVVTETKKGESPVVRPKEFKQRKKSTDSILPASAVVSENFEAVMSNSVQEHQEILPLPPAPPPRIKKHSKSQTLAAEDLLGIEMQTAAITWDNRGHEASHSTSVDDNVDLIENGPENKYTNLEKEHARNTITKKLKEIVTPKTSTKIVYDRAPMSPLTSTPIEIDTSGIADQDEGEDFVQYLKGLKAGVSLSSPETEDAEEHVLYARRRNSIGGSGENGFHLVDDLQVTSDNDNVSEDRAIAFQNTECIGHNEDYDSEEIMNIDQRECLENYQDENEKSAVDEAHKREDSIDSDNEKVNKDLENNDENGRSDSDADEENDDEDKDEDEDDDSSGGNSATNDGSDDDDNPYFDGQQDNGGDRQESFSDSSSEESDEGERDESFYGYSPGLRSRCNILAREVVEKQDSQEISISEPKPYENTAPQELCSGIVMDLLENVFSSVLEKQVFLRDGSDDENETIRNGLLESTFEDNSTVDCYNGNGCFVKENIDENTAMTGSRAKQFNFEEQSSVESSASCVKIENDTAKLPCEIAVVSDDITPIDTPSSSFADATETTNNETLESTTQVNETVIPEQGTLSEMADGRELDLIVQANGSEYQFRPEDISDALSDGTEESSDVLSDEIHETEFESALEDNLDALVAGPNANSEDFWSISLEQVFDSETDFAESEEFESLSDNNYGISDNENDLHDWVSYEGEVRDKTQGDVDRLSDVKLQQNAIPTCYESVENEALLVDNCIIKSADRNASFNANQSDTTYFVSQDGPENESVTNNTNFKAENSSASLTYDGDIVLKDEDEHTKETGKKHQPRVTSDQIIDETLNGAFEQVCDLIKIMQYESDLDKNITKSQNTDTNTYSEESAATVVMKRNEKQNASPKNTFPGKTHNHEESPAHNFDCLRDIPDNTLNNVGLQDKMSTSNKEKYHDVETKAINVESAKLNEKNESKVIHNELQNLIDLERPKYRTIAYNVPYIIPEEVKIKLSPEEEQKHVMLCKKKLALLNGHKRSENARKTKLKRQRIVQGAESNDSMVGNKITETVPTSKAKTLKVGSGYIILGAEKLLNKPEGPKTSMTNKGKDYCQGRPCKYFRGLPGVINNAYKMSNIFPKARPTTTAPPHHILHACNRLATPTIPTSTPSPSKENRYGIMLEAAAVENGSADNTDLKEILNNARDCLNCSKFDDAEAAFLKLYQQIQEKPEDNSKLLVETLTGLADICIRRSRMCRSNPLEWQWLCMHAIALLQYTVEFCDSELEDELDNQLSEWFREQKQASELKCRPLEDAFVRALYNSLKHNANFFDPFQSFSLPNTPVHSSRKTNLFPLSSNMPQYLVIPGMRYRVTDQGLQKQSSDDSNMAVDWLAKFQHYCKDRLQTKDSKECTEKILKSNASKTDDDDDDTASVVSHGSHGSLDWDNGDLQGNNTTQQIPGIDEVNEELLEEESPVKDYSLAFELASISSDNDGWDFFLDKRQNCNFQTVVQVNGSEECHEEKEEKPETTKDTVDVRQHEKPPKIVLRDMISPLHEHSISLTLSRSFCRLADKLVQEEEYRKAEAVYDKILDIIDTIQDGTCGMLKFSARIMKNLGTVKSKLGKSSSGLALLNKALQTYRDLQDEEANFEIAIALIELGNGYIVGKNHEDSVFEDVIIAICDFFEKDSGDPQSASTSSCGSTSAMTSSLRSENEERNVEEAVMCYSEAITLLDTYASEERQNEMLAKAVMRLGDCFFMQNDYDRALDCYERALGMFRACNIFGRDSLMENAHVLCMLGVSSFMLHVYPRAASVFEMALHMVKCAYGFKRTFLNGMLQSLSGITYYKMKNYHKCVSMCYQSFETYCDLFGEELSRLNKQKFWLVCQTLYVMGNSYNILSLYQKSIKYLTIARSLMKSSKSRERRQFMRVLQILGDSYFAQYDYKTALTFYNEALEYGECESTISFDEVFDPNCASDEMAIHNRLVSKSAEAHLSMQQYQNAVHYLEQAHDIQEVMGEDIKEDLINTLNQLGEMHSLAGDVDKAIESYRESLDVFREIHQGELGPDMCTTLGNLAAICYVKACLSDEIEEELRMIQMAEQYFKEALKLDIDDGVCVKYANFLYSQGHYEEAINDLNEALQYEDRMQMSDIVYTGLEKITLPDLLQDEVDTQEEICLPSACLARYLLILCHKALGQTLEAETNLIGLMEDVIDYDIPLLHSLLGYAMMELSLFEEAAMAFYKAFETEEDYILASENYCICIIIILLRTIQNAVLNVWEYYEPQQKRCLQ